MDISTQPATLQWVCDITALTQELGYSASEQQTSEWLSYLIASPIHQAYVAVNQSQQICGWVVVEKNITLEGGFKAEITGLVVGQAFRRLGVGQLMVMQVKRWAKEQGLSRLVVRSNAAREESHDFYQGIGFVRKKTSHTYEHRI